VATEQQRQADPARGADAAAKAEAAAKAANAAAPGTPGSQPAAQGSQADAAASWAAVGSRGSGARRAAAVLLGLGQEVAEEVFRLLDEEHVRKVALAAKELRHGASSEVPAALRGFVESMERIGGEVMAGEDLLRELTERSHGADLARRAFDLERTGFEPDDPLGPLAEADPEALAMVLVREHAQTIALILSALPAELAHETLSHLPDEKRADVLRRVAGVDAISPEVLSEVARAVNAELKASSAGGLRRVDGKGAALELLRRTEGPLQAELVAELEQMDPALAADLRSKLFTFQDLVNLTDRDVQALLKEADANRLAVALKGATPQLHDKIIRNMSSRAGEMLAEDLVAMGPVRLSVVEEAQAELVRLARDLADQGRITIASASDQML